MEGNAINYPSENSIRFATLPIHPTEALYRTLQGEHVDEKYQFVHPSKIA